MVRNGGLAMERVTTVYAVILLLVRGFNDLEFGDLRRVLQPCDWKVF